MSTLQTQIDFLYLGTSLKNIPLLALTSSTPHTTIILEMESLTRSSTF